MTQSNAKIWIKLFGFAEKYGITKLADNTMDVFAKALMENFWLPSPRSMNLAYKLIHTTSKLQLFVSPALVYTILNLEESDKLSSWNKRPTGSTCTIESRALVRCVSVDEGPVWHQGCKSPICATLRLPSTWKRRDLLTQG